MVGENMEYLIGLLTAVVFFVFLSIVAYVGYRFGKVKKSIPSEDDEVQRKREKMQQEFVELMNYDVNKALQRKKVK